ncbi:MAG: Mycothiol acetyltransferase [Candidatus Heimdallarchaeota archaeon LC_2]|nr:MAG: Mycothiol acetyltransferase [Candidatus Heimdallarchaeota archaeon LC_2]
MHANNASRFSIELLRRDNKDINLFAEYSQRYVEEVDKKPIDDEIKKIKSRSHIDHCWILKDDEKLGIVKIIRGNFYNLGVPSYLDNAQLNEILSIIEKDILSFHNFRIEGTLHNKYLLVALDRGYNIEFSRNKMELDLSNVDNCVSYTTLDIQTYKNHYFRELTDTYIDAYRGSIDERVGMFDQSIAHSAIKSILNNDFGKFRPDLSGLVFDKKELIGGILITILEDCPFVVIIGLKRKNQLKQVGRKLMSWAIENSQKQGYNKMRLWVTTENKIALKLYESLGFKEILIINSVYKNF